MKDDRHAMARIQTLFLDHAMENDIASLPISSQLSAAGSSARNHRLPERQNQTSAHSFLAYIASSSSSSSSMEWSLLSVLKASPATQANYVIVEGSKWIHSCGQRQSLATVLKNILKPYHGDASIKKKSEMRAMGELHGCTSYGIENFSKVSKVILPISAINFPTLAL